MLDTPIVAVVDDDESVRKATEDLLRSIGYDARSFASADEFLGWGDIGRAACLITDVKMPGKSGPELQSDLSRKAYGLPVIFVTAYPEASVRSRALESGAFGFFSKPVDADALGACVESAIADRFSWSEI